MIHSVHFVEWPDSLILPRDHPRVEAINHQASTFGEMVDLTGDFLDILPVITELYAECDISDLLTEIESLIVDCRRDIA